MRRRAIRPVVRAAERAHTCMRAFERTCTCIRAYVRTRTRGPTRRCCSFAFPAGTPRAHNGAVTDGQFTGGQATDPCPQCGSTAAVHSISELAALAQMQLDKMQGVNAAARCPAAGLERGAALRAGTRLGRRAAGRAAARQRRLAAAGPATMATAPSTPSTRRSRTWRSAQRRGSSGGPCPSACSARSTIASCRRWPRRLPGSRPCCASRSRSPSSIPTSAPA